MAEPTALDFEVTLQTLNYATRLLAAELDSGRLTDRALDTLADFGRSRRVALLMLEDDDSFEVAGEMSRGGLVDPDRRIPAAGTPLAAVIASRQAGEYGLVRDDPIPLPTDADGEPGKQCLCLPLIGSQSRIIGLATLERPHQDPLSEHDRQVLKVVTTLIAVSLENARLFKLATVDGLTELYVRRYFEIRLSEELARIRRVPAPLSLLMLDIDRFKSYNDTYGHQTGDVVLHRFAQLLKDAARRGIDIPCRFGGEEFVVILPATDAAGAWVFAERVRESCQTTPFPGPDEPLQVTVSGGVTTLLPEQDITETEFVRRADAALYEAKQSGRNRICVWGTAVG